MESSKDSVESGGFRSDKAEFWKECTELQSSARDHHKRVLEFFTRQTAYLLKLESIIHQQAVELENLKVKHTSAVKAVGVFLQREDNHRAVLKAAVEALEAETEKNVCQICLVSPRSVLIMPCMHLLYCVECLRAHQRTSNSCPMCRGTIKTWIPCTFNLD